MSDSLELRFRDVDAFGHVYHAEYLSFLDHLRTRWLREMGVESPESYVVARVEIDYVSSLLLADGAVTASFRPERVGGTSITLREELQVHGGRLVARAQVVIVLRDVATGSKRVVTDRERAALGV